MMEDGLAQLIVRDVEDGVARPRARLEPGCDSTAAIREMRDRDCASAT